MSHAGKASAEAPAGAITGRRSLILAACMTATFMTAVESTIVATACWSLWLNVISA